MLKEDFGGRGSSMMRPALAWGALTIALSGCAGSAFSSETDTGSGGVGFGGSAVAESPSTRNVHAAGTSAQDDAANAPAGGSNTAGTPAEDTGAPEEGAGGGASMDMRLVDAATDAIAEPDVQPISLPASRVVLVGESTTADHGGMASEPYRDICPENQVMIGYHGSTSNPGTELVFSIQARCGELTIPEAGNQIAVSESGVLPERGAPSASTWTELCPTDQLIVGIYGHAGLALDGIGFVCAPLEIVQDGMTHALTIGARTPLPAHGGSGGGAFQDGCPEGQVARGQSVRGNNWIESFALVCGEPRLEQIDGG